MNNSKIPENTVISMKPWLKRRWFDTVLHLFGKNMVFNGFCTIKCNPDPVTHLLTVTFAQFQKGLNSFVGKTGIRYKTVFLLNY